MNDYEREIPTAICPQCGAEYDDYEGNGLRYCYQCGYCEHREVKHGRCVDCGEKIEPERTR